ncbi:hypothetical protein LTR85_004116 [Meristemomyces frigidus]|nr:hypothetical protein LTR85_004116 [Meristemomyces frigidus]
MSADLVRQIAMGNIDYAKNHDPSTSFKDSPDMKAVMVISCMDPRASPNAFWNFGEQGPAVIRNAGGRASDALRSIRTLSTIMSYGRNTVGTVVVVHHTDCGLLNFDDHYVKEKLTERVKDSPELVSEVAKMEIGGLGNLEASIKEDVELIKADPFLPKDVEVLGFVYDTITGRTTEVV